jgi:hypothetical protein
MTIDFAYGHANSLPFILVSIGLIAFAIFIIAPNKRAVRGMLEKISALLIDVTELLDGTFTFPD